MTKTKPPLDDSIDLIELIQIFLTHKIKFIFFGLLGFAIGLMFTYNHETRFKTEFIFEIGHPLVNNDFLENSSAIQHLLNDSELNKNNLPNFQLKNKTFTVITEDDNVLHLVTDIFTNALKKELFEFKKIAKSLVTYENKKLIIEENSNKRLNLIVNNKDIANLNPEDVAQTLVFSYGDTKMLYPKPLKHSIIGFMFGLVIAFCWMIAAIILRQISLKK